MLELTAKKYAGKVIELDSKQMVSLIFYVLVLTYMISLAKKSISLGDSSMIIISLIGICLALFRMITVLFQMSKRHKE